MRFSTNPQSSSVSIYGKALSNTGGIYQMHFTYTGCNFDAQNKKITKGENMRTLSCTATPSPPSLLLS